VHAGAEPLRQSRLLRQALGRLTPCLAAWAVGACTSAGPAELPALASQPEIGAAAPRPEAVAKAAALDYAISSDSTPPVPGDDVLVIDADEDSAAVAELLSKWPVTATELATVPVGALEVRDANGTRRVIRWSVELVSLADGKAHTRVICRRGGRSGYGVEQQLRLVNGRWMVLEQMVCLRI
jgi:hypothetical protein